MAKGYMTTGSMRVAVSPLVCLWRPLFGWPLVLVLSAVRLRWYGACGIANGDVPKVLWLPRLPTRVSLRCRMPNGGEVSMYSCGQ